MVEDVGVALGGILQILNILKKARNLSQTVYLYGATGYGKTELVRQYLSGRRYTYLSSSFIRRATWWRT